MRLITLNIWGGHVREPLHQFIVSHKDIDVFCFQEVYHNANHMITLEDRKVSLNIFTDLQALLPDHIGYFRPVVDGIFGISIFVNKNFEVLGEGDFLIHENPDYIGRGPTHSRILQWLKYRIHNETYTVVNVHGLWNGKGKTDTEERIAQSKKIKQFMNTVEARKILCGDFNLKPNTQSLKMLSDDMIDLVASYNVTSTRTSLYPKEERYADYIFTSKDIKVSKFEVLEDEVSDHAALMLDFV